MVKAKKSQHFIKPISCHGLILTKGKSPISCTGGLLFLETLLGYTIARKLSKLSKSSMARIKSFSCLAISFFHRVLSNMLKNEIVENQIVGAC